ncbi:MAG: replication-associated recombination protein A [Cellvibrionales bacterium]|nr:replication-associated recombination protein A [Cellvibrionales bacterium]
MNAEPTATLWPAKSTAEPLAARLRPTTLDDFHGQHALLKPGTPLRHALESGHPHSMLLWGPPGTGKTTLARMLANRAQAQFIPLSAVTAGIQQVRAAIKQAQTAQASGRKTLLFVDEVHRFNKAQQDGFLPFIEDGTIIFIGATTENPAFALVGALLSRCKLYVLESLDQAALAAVLQRGMAQYPDLRLTQPQKRQLLDTADGDARRVLNLLEIAADCAAPSGQLDAAQFAALLSGRNRRFDRGGDHFYHQISALHKAVRGSNPDASLYWFARMLDGGCDPLYLARRLLRIASEDIGNADPRALTLCLNAWDTYARLGSPEGELALAQALLYLACAPKSNALYTALNQVMADIDRDPSYPVPPHLRNAPTKLAKSLGHGKNYRYAHDEPHHYAAGEQYLPPEIADRRYYQPSNQGLEARIGEKLTQLRNLDAQAQKSTNPAPTPEPATS